MWTGQQGISGTSLNFPVVRWQNKHAQKPHRCCGMRGFGSYSTRALSTSCKGRPACDKFISGNESIPSFVLRSQTDGEFFFEESTNEKSRVRLGGLCGKERRTNACKRNACFSGWSCRLLVSMRLTWPGTSTPQVLLVVLIGPACATTHHDAMISGCNAPVQYRLRCLLLKTSPILSTSQVRGRS